MFLTGFQHEDAAVFFNNLSRDFLQAICANGGRRFNETVDSKMSPRELDVRRRNVYEISGSIQVISQMIKVKVAGVAKTSGCLLYTSPSPRDRQKSRMPSSA